MSPTKSEATRRHAEYYATTTSEADRLQREAVPTPATEVEAERADIAHGDIIRVKTTGNSFVVKANLGRRFHPPITVEGSDSLFSLDEIELVSKRFPPTTDSQQPVAERQKFYTVGLTVYRRRTDETNSVHDEFIAECRTVQFATQITEALNAQVS